MNRQAYGNCLKHIHSSKKSVAYNRKLFHIDNIRIKTDRKDMKQKQHKALKVVLAAAAILCIIPAIRNAAKETASGKVILKEHTVVIDAGHGGDDPGKVGINGALEKDVNLQIALLVRQYLEANDVAVVMTREDENGLYDRHASNKKVQDMKRRVELIEDTAPVLTISIHQNSYPEEYVHGAQVFYYKDSLEGLHLAEKIQKRLVEGVDPENKRQVKANDSYYLLKKTRTPIVIVECGFLSNGDEAEKLCSEDYQKELAWEISMGVLQYLNEND